MKIKKLDPLDETKVRIWMMRYDSDLAMHDQLRNYFLTSAPDFGTLGILDEHDRILAVSLFSRYNDKAYIHRYYGDVTWVEDIIDFLEMVETEVFLDDEQIDEMESRVASWREDLRVTPGYCVDHPAYDGVFSRVVPRFAGRVYTVS